MMQVEQDSADLSPVSDEEEYKEKPKLQSHPLAGPSKQARTILDWQAEESESIIECRFVDDERPQMMFVLLESNDKKVQYLKLVKILNRENDRLT